MTPEDERRGDSWYEYRRLVMAGLRELKEEIKHLDEKLDKVSNDVLMLKVKAGVWGGVVGAMGAAFVSYLFNLIRGK